MYKTRAYQLVKQAASRRLDSPAPCLGITQKLVNTNACAGVARDTWSSGKEPEGAEKPRCFHMAQTKKHTATSFSLSF